MSLLLVRQHFQSAINYFATLSTNRCLTILGIESSCDDSSIAVVNSDGETITAHSESQLAWHNRIGGVDPTEAQRLHQRNLPSVLKRVINDVDPESIDYVSVTTCPGLRPSLIEGIRLAIDFAKFHRKSIIPVHHMRAHATVIRLTNPTVQYPFLSLLASGGHCLLTLVVSPDQHLILGQTLDHAPGEVLDKAARYMGLYQRLPDFQDLSGGHIIETLASRADQTIANPYSMPVRAQYRHRDCNFFFAGLLNATKVHTQKIEDNSGSKDAIVNMKEFELLAYALQAGIFRQMLDRLRRAIVIIDSLHAKESHYYIPILAGALGKRKLEHLVFGGGCACNEYFRRELTKACEKHLNLKLVYPPPKHCGDNGEMIAWQAHECLRAGTAQIVKNNDLPDNYDPDADGPLQPEYRIPIGVDIADQVANLNVKLIRN